MNIRSVFQSVRVSVCVLVCFSVSHGLFVVAMDAAAVESVNVRITPLRVPLSGPSDLLITCVSFVNGCSSGLQS